MLPSFHAHEAKFNKLIMLMPRRPKNSATLHMLTRVVTHAQKQVKICLLGHDGGEQLPLSNVLGHLCSVEIGMLAGPPYTIIENISEIFGVITRAHVPMSTHRTERMSSEMAACDADLDAQFRAHCDVLTILQNIDNHAVDCPGRM